MVNVFVAVVLINPFVRSKFLFTSIAPPALTVIPAALSISKLLKAFEPVKSPKLPPVVCADDPEKLTVAPAPVPLVKAPVLYRSIVP